MANNDWGVGQLFDWVCHSKNWLETAIFTIKEDVQNGPGHVDLQQITNLVISPYSKQGAVDSTMYTMSSMIRTMEHCWACHQ